LPAASIELWQHGGKGSGSLSGEDEEPYKKERIERIKTKLDLEEKGELGCFYSDIQEYAILVELYKVAGAEILWNTKDKQFLEQLVEETLNLRKTDEQRKEEYAKKAIEKARESLKGVTSIEGFDSSSGKKASIDVSDLFN